MLARITIWLLFFLSTCIYLCCCTVKLILKDHYHERPPVLKDQIFMVEIPTFQCNWTCHQRLRLGHSRQVPLQCIINLTLSKEITIAVIMLPFHFVLHFCSFEYLFWWNNFQKSEGITKNTCRLWDAIFLINFCDLVRFQVHHFQYSMRNPWCHPSIFPQLTLCTECTVKLVLRDHCPERLPALTNHTFLAQEPINFNIT